MTTQVTPLRLVGWLNKRRHQDHSVCIIEPDEDRRIAWFAAFLDLVEGSACDKYAVNRIDLSVSINWEHTLPEHSVRVFASYLDACKAVYGSVCDADFSPETDD